MDPVFEDLTNLRILCVIYRQGKGLIFLKKRGFLNFPKINMESFSPAAFTAAIALT